jgi:hypothetical protein
VPIVVTNPLPNAPFGPGFRVSASSDTGAFDPSFRWLIEVRDEGGNPVISEGRPIGTAPPFFINLVFLTDASQALTLGSGTGMTDGQTGTLHVAIGSAFTTAEQLNVPIRWDGASQVGVQNAILAQQGHVAGGFTAQDRALLQTTADASVVDLTLTTPPPNIRSVPIGRLPGLLPVIWNERVGPFTLIGRGSVDLSPSARRGIWVAMRWFFTVIPAGWGMTPGAIDEFDARPAQLVPVYVLESGEEIGMPVMDVNTSGGYFQFQQGPGVTRVEYDISPGWTVTLFTYRVIGSG